jgi:class 3 adenylate cyclase/tetratricopeptide (TPR) repeat protein
VSERRQERKVVSVLFCDLVGFTQRAEEMDPEDVAALLEPYHARLKGELERHGGTVEKFIGDAVMALFGAPIAHEDDPERAVRAALAIRSFAEDEGIELRIGITTGEALVTLAARPEQGETVATGDVVNTAARLQAAAPVNGILVSEKTRAATSDAIEYEVAEPVEAKGKSQPVPVWEARRARSRITLDRLHGTPLVGRARELDLLEDALARAREERQPQLVTLVGVPGMGKSRLVYELSQGVDRDPDIISWRQGRCLPYGEGVTFWALGEIVKAQAGILESDSAEAAEEKLAAVATDEWLRDHLRPLLGLGTNGFPDAGQREEMFAAWRRFLEGLAAQRPLITVFEDLHWADDDLLDFVDHLVEWASGVPLLVVCTARPELLERRPGWGGGKTNASTVSLSPLSSQETAQLVGRLLQRAILPAETQQALIARAGGNPLYAEQYARLLEERLEVDLTLPATVQGIIAARLDLLSPEQKSLLQDAAVAGKVFWAGALAAISTAEPRAAEEQLHALERKGFVRREQETTVVGDTEYAFLHVLVREVAYGQIPRVPRAEKHRLMAQWIESLGRSEDHAEMLAHHYGEALDLAFAAGADTTALTQSARRAFVDAGDRASALNAHAGALRYYERALDLWPDDDERPRLLLRVARAAFLAGDEARTALYDEAREAFLAQGEREAAAEAEMAAAVAARTVGRSVEALERAARAAELVREAPATREKAYVLAERARLAMNMIRYEEALELAGAALAVVEDAGDEAMRAHVLHTSGYSRVLTDDFSGIVDLEESLAVGVEHVSSWDLARFYNNTGNAYLHMGEIQRSTELVHTNLEHARRLGLSTRWPRAVLAGHTFWLGDWVQAEQLVTEFLAETSGRHALEPSVLDLRARLRLARDDVEGAVADCARAVELSRAFWRDKPPVGFVSTRAQIALAKGRRQDAVSDIEHLLALDGATLVSWIGTVVELALTLTQLELSGEAILELADARPEVPWHQIAAAIVRGDLESAAKRLHELQIAPLEAAVRLLAAERLAAGGRRAEADAQLHDALAFYRSVGATRYIREGEALLAASA